MELFEDYTPNSMEFTPAVPENAATKKQVNKIPLSLVLVLFLAITMFTILSVAGKTCGQSISVLIFRQNSLDATSFRMFFARLRFIWPRPLLKRAYHHAIIIVIVMDSTRLHPPDP